MQLWRYFEIGVGVKQKYTGVKFTPKYDVLKPFHYCDIREDSDDGGSSNKPKSKIREDRVLCTLQFCMEEGCSASFEKKTELEEHMVSGKHIYPKQKTAMDRVKASFMDRMKSSSQLHLPISTAEQMAFADINFESSCRLYPAFSFFKEPGWALPVRSNFRFCFQQLSLLYIYFMEGEKSGKKMSPGQVEKLLRKDLTPDMYVTTQQIKSLFSRWATKYKNGTLKPPKDKAVSNKEIVDEEVDEEDDEEVINSEEQDDINKEYIDAVKEQVMLISEELNFQYKKDDWVTVVYEGHWYPGQVNEVNENGVTVACMEHAAAAYATSSFRWPKKPDVHPYPDDDVLCCIEPPQPVNQRGAYRLSNVDLGKTMAAFNEYLEQ